MTPSSDGHGQPRAPGGLNAQQRLAAWLAVTPIAVALALLAAFVATDVVHLAFAGVPLLWAGLVTTGAAALLTLLGWRRARADGAPQRRARAVVTLQNDAATAWRDVRLEAPAVDETVTVAPNATRAVTVWFQGDGELRLLDGARTTVRRGLRDAQPGRPRHDHAPRRRHARLRAVKRDRRRGPRVS
jgi:hypothetical protein